MIFPTKFFLKFYLWEKWVKLAKKACQWAKQCNFGKGGAGCGTMSSDKAADDWLIGSRWKCPSVNKGLSLGSYICMYNLNLKYAIRCRTGNCTLEDVSFGKLFPVPLGGTLGTLWTLGTFDVTPHQFCDSGKKKTDYFKKLSFCWRVNSRI